MGPGQEFERDLIRERTNAGLQAARARGRVGGRPPLLTKDKLRTASRMYEQQDMTVEKIGEVLGVSRTTGYRALRRNPAPTQLRRRKASATRSV
jgi:DNA invertase Pin-like site-specific DNA recombinase